MTSAEGVTQGRKVRREAALLAWTAAAGLTVISASLIFPAFASALLSLAYKANPLTQWVLEPVVRANESILPDIRRRWDSETAQLYDVRSQVIFLVLVLVYAVHIVEITVIIARGRARNVISRNSQHIRKILSHDKILVALALVFWIGMCAWLMSEFAAPDIMERGGRRSLKPHIPSLIFHSALHVACSWGFAVLLATLFVDHDQLRRELEGETWKER